MTTLNDVQTGTVTLADQAPDTSSSVSFDNFFTSNEEISRSQELEQAKQRKLDRLTRINQNASLDDSYTDLGGGRIESNKNKIWNSLSDQEIQSLMEYGLDKYTLTPDEEGNYKYKSGEAYSGPARRLYMFGTKGNPNEVKFGLAKGDLTGAEERYKDSGLLGGYGWVPGESGVNIEDKRMDVLLPYNVATMLEGLAHGRESALANRSVPDIYSDPSNTNLYGSGASEYYTSKEGLFGAPAEVDLGLGEQLLSQYLGDIQRQNPSGGIVDKELDLQRILRENQEYAADNSNTLDRTLNTISGLGASFVDSLLVSPTDALGDLTGLYDIGSDKENTAAVNEFFGYNPVQAERAMTNIGDQWNIVADSDASTKDRIKAAGNGILEAFITPEMWGTSMGMLASWVMPGSILKAVGVGSKFAKSVKVIDAAAEAGTITKNAARLQKAKAFLSVNGAKAALASQSGFMVSAVGEVNKQYNEFVSNNNGVALEGADKAAWFAGRFAVQLVNQNLDKLVDFNVIKSAGLLSGAIPAVKAMTNKEFANVAKTMAKGVVITTTNMGSEAAQEYTQTMMELFNSRYGSEKFKDADTFGKFLSDGRNLTEAGIAALAGAGGAPQFEAIGSLKGIAAGSAVGASKLGGKVGKAIKTRGGESAPVVALPPTTIAAYTSTPEQIAERTKTAEVDADAIVSKYSNMLGDEEGANLFITDDTKEEELVDTPKLKEALRKDPTSYETTFKEIEKAEAVINNRVNSKTAKDTDEFALKVLRKTKRQVALNAMEDESHPTLGSGYSPVDILETFVESTEVKDGKLDITSEEEKTLAAFIKDNDIPPLRFENFRKYRTEHKDPSEVQEEALGSGERSASSYNRKLRDLVNTPNPDRKAIAKIVDDIDGFLNSQEARKTVFESVVNEVKANLFNYNKQIAEGKVIPKAVKKKLLAGKNVPGYKNSFVAVSEDASGKLRVNENSVAVLGSINDNIDYLKRVKTRYGAQVKNILGDVSTSSVTGISVRPNSKVQEARDNDQKFYEKRGVTKAIVGDKASAQWSTGGDYLNDNSTIVNTGTYIEDDVVVVNSTAKGFAKGDKLRKELTKAYNAGATIVIDREVASNVALQRLLQQYHFKKVDDDGVTKFLPKAKAKIVRDKQAAKKQVTREKERSLKKLVQAYESGDKAVINDIVKERFEGNYEKAKNFYNNLVNNKAKELGDKLLNIAVTKGLNSVELSDAMAAMSNSARKGNLPNAAVNEAFKAVEEKITELEKGETLLKEWNDAQKEAKKGKIDFSRWLKENIKNPAGIVKTMFEEAIGKGREAVYVYYDAAKKDFSVPTSNIKNIPDGVSYQVIELDPNKYATVNKVTPLNTLTGKDLRIAGQDNIAFNQLLTTAVDLLSKTIREPNLVYKNSKNSILDLVNSPAATLIFNKDMKVNDNVAIAMHIAMYNFVKNNTYLLKKGKKSKADIAEILGIDESQLSREAVQLMNDKGLLYKTAANSVGKDIAGILGLARKSDSESDIQAYDSLLADLGQTALLMGVVDNLFELDNSLSAAEFASTVLRKSKNTITGDNGAKVIFIQVRPGEEDNISTVAEQAKLISNSIPDTDIGRKEPSFTPLDNKVINKAISKIRKEKLGLKIANASQKALKSLMNTEWEADLTLMQEMLDNADLIKARLGYIKIPSSAYDNLSFEEKETQESINRGLDKSFDEMQWIVQSNAGSSSTSLWFKYFFSKNGRFFVDSNTINPQADKHLHRFAVQPKSHVNTYKRVGNKFFVGKKDVTSNVHYALSQAFGFATDKKDTAKIDANAKNIISKLKTIDAIKKAKMQLLNHGKVEGLGIEIEHLGHALQGFKFLESMLSTKTGGFTSALTAEFDAVTSGFGLKNLQMPIIKGIDDWLKKVGILLNTDSTLSGDQVVSMNDILDSGNVLDSYQTLASNVEQTSFETMFDELQSMGESDRRLNIVVSDSEYSRNLWDALSDVLPQTNLDGSISKDLRNLFKYPFMTFNYSASIKSIRKNLLTGELLSSIAKAMAAADITNEEDSVVKLMKTFVGESGNVAKLQNDIRSNPLSKIRAHKGASSTLEQHLGQMIEASYGAQVEKILTSQFKPFVDAQEKVNTAFRAMFEVFAISFERKLEEARKKGPVSADKEREIYNSLKDEWPAIKGPLSSMEDEINEGNGVGIYDTQTSSPFGVYSGRKPVRANLSKELSQKLGQKDVRVTSMVKQMVAAVAAGSVVPIHYIDGAIMAQTINGLSDTGVNGVTVIHDAIMPSLVNIDKAQKEYNKQVLEVNNNYSFINEIGKTLADLVDRIPVNGSKYRNVMVDARDEEGKTVKVSLPAFVLSTYNNFTTLANDVADKREILYSRLNEGAKIMHMAGTKDGVYAVDAGTIKHKPVEKLSTKGYNTAKDIEVNGVKLSGLNGLTQNLC